MQITEMEKTMNGIRGGVDVLLGVDGLGRGKDISHDYFRVFLSILLY